MFCAGCCSDKCSVAIELDDRGVRVDNDRGLAARCHHVVAVPCGDGVQGCFVLIPLAAVEVVGVLFEARGLDYAEIAAVGDATSSAVSTSCSVPWGRLAEIVEACPDEFAGDAVILIGIVD